MHNIRNEHIYTRHICISLLSWHGWTEQEENALTQVHCLRMQWHEMVDSREGGTDHSAFAFGAQAYHSLHRTVPLCLLQTFTTVSIVQCPCAYCRLLPQSPSHSALVPIADSYHSLHRTVPLCLLQTFCKCSCKLSLVLPGQASKNMTLTNSIRHKRQCLNQCSHMC